MADALNFLRQDALHKRVNGIAGGNRILWQAKDLPALHEHVMSVKPEQIIRATQPTEVKISESKIDKAGLGIQLRSSAGPDDNPVFPITTPRVDLANDRTDPRNVDLTDFLKFLSVLDTHDSSKPPVALSTRPWLSGSSMLAIAKFPKPGVSANSDQISAAVRAGLTRGASIGFVPLSWSFSKDPSRPLGIDFHSIKLLEWSIVSLPCNQDCSIAGWVSGATSSPDSSKMAELRREARALAAKGRSICAGITDKPPSTREQRLVEAQNIRRAMIAATK
jgi:hypothetical protein